MLRRSFDLSLFFLCTLGSIKSPRCTTSVAWAMSGNTLGGDAPGKTIWRLHYPLSWPFAWLYHRFYGMLVIVFAPWPSMHDPIKLLLNAQDRDLADRLTEKWTVAKLSELQYVGLTVRLYF